MQHETDTVDNGVAAAVEQDNTSAEASANFPSTEECIEELDPQTQIANLEKELANLNDLYVRSQAEIQNIQRRSVEDIKKARDYAFSSFAKDVVVIKDYLEMALADQSGNIDTLKTGVDLTLKQVVQIFERNYIKEICPATGDKLDPHLHQAMNSVDAEGQEANSIVSIMQKGYTLNNRVLRPAMVVIAK